ncbi:transmembrane protein 98-like [Paramacrobiotus metropolitanus]|uniref:transmembrane protein 98-like n=1 Tax=Paramacrobiotus metropolitanus TaxID=2943436 RepID=UPI002445C764|nr:transmembrane protein 98-like [Paramacrobiotus metropolitanus]
METVVAVGIGILTVVILAFVVGIAMVARYRLCRRKEEIDATELIEQHTGGQKNGLGDEIELGEIVLSDEEIDRIVQNAQWIEDISGWIPHCLSILRTCHNLTEKLVTMTLGKENYKYACRTGKMDALLKVAKSIGPRIDDIARSMEPPLDSRLLEARCVALVVSVEQLVLVTQTVCGSVGKRIQWIESALADLHVHLQVLRQAATEAEKEAADRPFSRQSSSRRGVTALYPTAAASSNFGQQEMQIPVLTVTDASPV